MKAYERFLKYVSVWTTSEEGSDTTPSAARELDLARMLVEEMKAMGVEDAVMEENGYVYGSIPATAGLERKPVVGLIAHLDTTESCSGKDVKPQLIRNYDGTDIKLGNSGKILQVKDFPHLKTLKGQTLITTDGTTLLGADDKAGIAEIMTAAEHLLERKIPHGKICLGFTPDEEIGSGAEELGLEKFGAQYAYTVDGDTEGEIQFENFNASGATLTAHGVSVHTGDAKGIMVNAQQILIDLHNMLPEKERPEHTEGYEGFYHLMSIKGDVAEAESKYLIRDFDDGGFENRENEMRNAVAKVNEKYGEGCLELEITPSYRNMRTKIEPCMQLVEYAKEAGLKAGVAPLIVPIRGGTDGAQLSYRGLPCPNLGTGGHAFHGPYEHITVEAMDKVVEILENILEKFAEE